MSSILATHQPSILAVRRRLFGLARTIYVGRCSCGRFRVERSSADGAGQALVEHRKQVAA